jgi:hypothetical protein
VPADVTGGERAVDRVGDGMHTDIGVRMAIKPPVVRHADAAEHYMVTRPEPVHVDPVAKANIHVVQSHALGFHQPLGGGASADNGDALPVEMHIL